MVIKSKQTFFWRIPIDGQQVYGKVLFIIKHQRDASKSTMKYKCIPVRMVIVKKKGIYMFICIFICVNKWHIYMCWAVLSCSAHSCQTLCVPMDCSPPGSSLYGDSPGKNTVVGCHAFLQGIFPTQRLNLGLLHCRQILYHLSYQWRPRILE